MWVPYKAGSGEARVTLTYPGLEGWNIHPATVGVPVEAGRWWAHLLAYGPWVSAGLLAVAGVYVVVRRRAARRGRR